MSSLPGFMNGNVQRVRLPVSTRTQQGWAADGEGPEEEAHLAQITQVLQERDTEPSSLFPSKCFGLGAETTLSYSHVCWPL